MKFWLILIPAYFLLLLFFWTLCRAAALADWDSEKCYTPKAGECESDGTAAI